MINDLMTSNGEMVTLERISADGVLMKCDESSINDLIWILDRLLSMSRTLKQRMRYAKAYERVNDEKERAAQKEKFDQKSVKVYKVYRKNKEAGISYSQAVYKTRQQLGLGYTDTEIYVRNGKKVFQNQSSGDL